MTITTPHHQPSATNGREHAKALAQREAADEAVALLLTALGDRVPDLARLHDAAGFRFGVALAQALRRTTA